MERLIRFALRRRGLVAVIFIVVSLFGIYSWTRLSIDAYPDIADVTVQVVTQVPGLAAEEIEQQITIPLERALNGIPSLDMMRSKNAFGLSIIILVFQDGTEDYWARQRVRECIGDVDLYHLCEVIGLAAESLRLIDEVHFDDWCGLAAEKI